MVPSRVTVNALRSVLKARGLSSNGKKQALIDRCAANGVAIPAAGMSAPAAATVPASDQVSSLAPGVPAAGAPSQLAATTTADTASTEALDEAAGTETAPVQHTVVPLVPFAGNGVPAAAVAEPARSTASSPVTTGSVPARSPPFSKHEQARLCHVMCMPEVAAGVVASRGCMSRMQQDNRTKRSAVWVAVVCPAFNGSASFTKPPPCADMDIDANVHPLERTGERLHTKWTEVRCLFLFALIVPFVCCFRYGSFTRDARYHLVPVL